MAHQAARSEEIPNTHAGSYRMWRGRRAPGKMCFSSRCWISLCMLVASAVLLAGPAAAQSPNPIPLINQPPVPEAALPGGAEFTLTVNGTGFVSGATVDWNGTPLITAFVSGSQLTATVPAADIASAGTASVTVVNPGGGPSNVVLFPVATSEVTPAFTDATDSPFSVQGLPLVLATADFNGDGISDFAVTSRLSLSDYGFSIFLSQGDGTFTEPTGYQALSSGVGQIAAGDFDGDGNVDLAITTPGTQTVLILIGDGMGHFSNGDTPGTGLTSRSLATADLDGDGNLDLAVVNFDSDTVTVLLGGGKGDFSLKSSPATGHSPGGVAVGDFDSDGNLDLAVADTGDNDVSILLGIGDGTFKPRSTVATGNLPLGVAAADVNGDGNLDLAVTDLSDNDLTILPGNGDGTFSTPSTVATGQSPVVVVVGDFNSDGKLDLATSGSDHGTVLVGDGAGGFSVGATPTSIGGVPPNEALAAGDFNADGRLDLAGVNEIHGSALALVQQQPVSAPVVSLSSASLDFGNQAVGTTSAEMTLTVTNSGSADLNITTVTLSGADMADFGTPTNTCAGATIVPGDTCSVGVTFTPSATGAESASLAFTDDASDSPQTVALIGTGAVLGASVSPASLDFSSQVVGTASAAQTVTLTNNSVVDLTITGITVTGDFAETNNCGSSLAATSSCTIDVTFNPTTSGALSGTLSVDDNASGSPQTVAVSGTGEDFALSASPMEVTVNQGNAATFDLTVMPEGGFTGTVTLSCSDAPSMSTCTVSPASVTLDGSSSASATVSISTTGSSMIAPRAPSPPVGWPMTVWFILVGLAGLALLARLELRLGRVRLGLVAPLVVLLASVIFCASCANNTGTPAGTYSLTVTGTSGSRTHSSNVMLTVK